MFLELRHHRPVAVAALLERHRKRPIERIGDLIDVTQDLFKIADLLGPPSSPTELPPPEGALLVGRNDLPQRLQRLDPGLSAQVAAPGGAPRIVYPPEGALIEWHGEEVPLEASGGKQPYRWIVDGKPLPAGQPRRPVYWQPAGIGFARLTVIDAQGHSAHSSVRLSP